MSDLFHDKAHEWDQRPVPQQISEGVGSALTSAITLQPGWTVLDFGAGTGLLAARVAPQVTRIIAVDVSPAMLEQLARKPELQGKATIVCADLTEQPLGEPVDLVVSAMALHHVADTRAILRALEQALKPGGQLALADLDTEPGDFHAPGTVGVFHYGFDRGALATLLAETGFHETRFETACVVSKGERHYPVFLVTARKPAAPDPS